MAEGAPLLRAYRRNLIEGSNPSLSAKFQVLVLYKFIFPLLYSCCSNTAAVI